VASHQRSRGWLGNADAAHSTGYSDWTTGESNASPGTQPHPSKSSPQTSPACSVQNGRPSVDVGADWAYRATVWSLSGLGDLTVADHMVLQADELPSRAESVGA
jgi:hypothetical protein